MRKIWAIATIGIVIRVLLSVITFHPDMMAFDAAGKIVSSGNILNLYDFSSNSVVFNYPPLIYLFHGLFRFLFGGIFGLLIVKLPYLIFDVFTGIILLKIFDSPKKSVAAFALWMFNPINLYATYMMGQFDIIPTFFIILSVYMAMKNKLEWAAVSLGFGIAFKLSPVFLIIPLIIFGKNIKERVKLFCIAILPYIISIIPYISSRTFRANALFANQSSKSLYASIPVSGGEAIILFPLFLLVFYLLIWNKMNYSAVSKAFLCCANVNCEVSLRASSSCNLTSPKPAASYSGSRIKPEIWKLYLVPLLLFFIFTHYHPQWLIWITPLLILDLIANEFKNLLPILLVFFSWVASLFFFDPSLTIGIFTPVSSVLQNSSGIWTILHLNPDYNSSRSILQTIFAAASFYLIYKHFPVKHES